MYVLVCKALLSVLANKKIQKNVSRMLAFVVFSVAVAKSRANFSLEVASAAKVEADSVKEREKRRDS